VVDDARVDVARLRDRRGVREHGRRVAHRVGELARIARDERLPAETREAARADLIRANLRFAFSVAKKFNGRGVALEDLVAEANAGLVRAADKYDPDVGVNFISYAVWWIRQAIFAALAKNGHVVRLPLNRATDYGHVVKAAAVLRAELGREPTDAEIAAVARLSPDVVRSVRLLMQPEQSFDEPAPGRRGERSGHRLADVLAVTEDADETDRGAGEASQHEALRRLLDALGPRDRKVIEMYYGLDGDEPRTLKEIGSALGVTRERVRQLRDRALERLRGEPAATLRREWVA
jgi:RNA polymerase primary sigma factor